jgi:hypothetical protein
MTFPTIVEVEGTLTSWRAARPTNRGSRCKSLFCASLFFKNQGREFSGALLGPLAQSLFSARVPIAPGPHSFSSFQCRVRYTKFAMLSISSASDLQIGQVTIAKFPQCGAGKITMRLYSPSVFRSRARAIRSSIHACAAAHRRSLRRFGAIVAFAIGKKYRLSRTGRPVQQKRSGFGPGFRY